MSSGINTKTRSSIHRIRQRTFRSVMDQVHDKESFVVASPQYQEPRHRSRGRIAWDHQQLHRPSPRSFEMPSSNKGQCGDPCHNHPSGDLTPSSEDLTVTKDWKETGNLLGIQVLDHLIIMESISRMSIRFRPTACWKRQLLTDKRKRSGDIQRRRHPGKTSRMDLRKSRISWSKESVIFSVVKNIRTTCAPCRGSIIIP